MNVQLHTMYRLVLAGALAVMPVCEVSAINYGHIGSRISSLVSRVPGGLATIAATSATAAASVLAYLWRSGVISIQDVSRAAVYYGIPLVVLVAAFGYAQAAVTEKIRAVYRSVEARAQAELHKQLRGAQDALKFVEGHVPSLLHKASTKSPFDMSSDNISVIAVKIGSKIARLYGILDGGSVKTNTASSNVQKFIEGSQETIDRESIEIPGLKEAILDSATPADKLISLPAKLKSMCAAQVNLSGNIAALVGNKLYLVHVGVNPQQIPLACLYIKNSDGTSEIRLITGDMLEQNNVIDLAGKQGAVVLMSQGAWRELMNLQTVRMTDIIATIVQDTINAKQHVLITADARDISQNIADVATTARVHAHEGSIAVQVVLFGELGKKPKLVRMRKERSSAPSWRERITSWLSSVPASSPEGYSSE